MIEPKFHLKKITRSTPENYDRSKFLRLDKNEDIIGLPDDFVQKVLSEVTPNIISTYPQTDVLYKKIATNLSLEIDNILITAGSDAAIKNIFEVYVCPGDLVVIPDPTYAMYEVYANLFDAKIQKIEYDSELQLPIERIIEASRNARLIVLANPGSPTGTIVNYDDIIRLLDATKNTNTLVLIDEAYYLFYEETVINLIQQFDHLIVTRTFSKAFSLASLRLGYVVAQSDVIQALNTFRPIYEVNLFAVLFGSALLDNLDIIGKGIQEILDGREYLIKEVAKMGFLTYPTYTNFLHIVVGRQHINPITDHFYRNGILIKSGFHHEVLSKCIRVTVGPVESMKVFLNVFKEYIEHNNIPPQ